MKKKRLTLCIAIAAFLLALGITLYPIISSTYNTHHQSQIHTQYEAQVEQAEDETLLLAKQQAQVYNLSICPIQTEDAFSNDSLAFAAEDYADLLNVTGNGIMGYVVIPGIDVELPIYHGTNDSTLEIGVGHLLGSSLPIGGEGTHTVLTAHSGMASQKMFSDLPGVQNGDVFYLQVLGETLAYEVDLINTVLPYDTSYLGITPGEDYCTLITCTPVGVNTHRLLVRGHRIPYEEAEIIEQTLPAKEPTSTWEQAYIKGLLIGVSVVAAVSFVLLVVWFYRRDHNENQ